MQKIDVKKNGDILIIGEEPQLIVNLKSQENFIKVGHQEYPYRKPILFSRDLLAGEREPVWNTAVGHYYRQACAAAEGMQAAMQYRSRINTAVREIR